MYWPVRTEARLGEHSEVLDKGIGEMGATGSELIKVGGFQPLRCIGMKSHEIMAMIIAQNEHEVRGRSCGNAKTEDEEKDEQRRWLHDDGHCS